MEFMETTVSQEYKFKGRVINTRVDQVLLPNGKPAEREAVSYTHLDVYKRQVPWLRC